MHRKTSFSMSESCRREECEEPGWIEGSARSDPAADVQAERSDLFDRLPDDSSMQSSGKENRDCRFLPDPAADLPVMTPAGPSEFLHGHVRPA
jgi:hypothetical protein